MFSPSTICRCPMKASLKLIIAVLKLLKLQGFFCCQRHVLRIIIEKNLKTSQIAHLPPRQLVKYIFTKEHISGFRENEKAGK